MKSVGVLIVLIFSFTELYAQVSYIDNYPGIPIIAALNRDPSLITADHLIRMRELGVMGFPARDITQSDVDSFYLQGLRVFPYPIWNDAALTTKYTDAYFTCWEAEGKGDGLNGDVELKYDTALAETFIEGDTIGIKTKDNQAGQLFEGPCYYQEKTYRLLPSNKTPIVYTADYHMKIIQTGTLPPGYLDDIVCRLEIVSTNPCYLEPQTRDAWPPKEIRVRDFLMNGTIWNQWVKHSINDYNLNSLVDVKDKIPNPCSEIDNNHKWMQYRVYWYGLPYLQLYVDRIEVHDPRGMELQDEVYRNLIKEYIQNKYTDNSKFLGWFGSNEPMTIDSYEPFRIVNNIVHQATNNQLYLYTGFTSGWGGIYGQPWPQELPNGYVYKITEFKKRTKLPLIHFNSHMYNQPALPGETDWLRKNINESSEGRRYKKQ